MMELAKRPDLEQIVAERLAKYQMTPDLVVAFSQMLGEWELHWWTEGRKLGRSENLNALVAKAISQ